MFSEYQLKRIDQLVVRGKPPNFIVRTSLNEYQVTIKGKPSDWSCECNHYNRITIHDQKTKDFMKTHWCAHIGAVLNHINYNGFKNFREKYVQNRQNIQRKNAKKKTLGRN